MTTPISVSDPKVTVARTALTTTIISSTNSTQTRIFSTTSINYSSVIVYQSPNAATNTPTSSSGASTSAETKVTLLAIFMLAVIIAVVIAFYWTRYRRINNEYATALLNEPGLSREMFVERFLQREREEDTPYLGGTAA